MDANVIRTELVPALKAHVKIVTEVDRTKTTVADRMNVLCAVCNSCKHLVQSLDSVLNRNVLLAQMKEPSLDGILKLRRRLWRVLRYIAGPQKFLRRGIDILKSKVVALNGNTLKLVFVAEWVAVSAATRLAPLFAPGASQPIVYKKAEFDTWFADTFKGSEIKETKVKAAKEAIMRHFAGKPQLTFSPALHCEVTLLTLLYLTDTKTVVCVAVRFCDHIL